MYKGTWSSTLYYSHVKNGTIDINTKEGWIDFTYEGIYNPSYSNHYTFDPNRLIESEILFISSYFTINIEEYTSKLIRGTYQTYSSYDYGIFTCVKEKSKNKCCKLL